MSDQDDGPKLRLPIHLILLDFAGALMIVVAAMEWLDPGSTLPSHYASRPYLLGLIVLGILLMWPLIRRIMQHAQDVRSVKQSKQ